MKFSVLVVEIEDSECFFFFKNDDLHAVEWSGRVKDLDEMEFLKKNEWNLYIQGSRNDPDFSNK